MEHDTETTDVIFKLERGTCDQVVAFFPGLPGTGRWDCTCYAHVGQHSSADLGYLTTCRPAAPTSYADLKRELESLGYNLKVVKRRTAKHDAQRHQAMADA
jgi:hypothetical protein